MSSWNSSPGEPLVDDSSIRHPNGVAPRACAQVVQGLAQAIIALHEHGIVHRDLKKSRATSSSKTASSKVGDYGLCKLIATAITPA